jgi:hypothetical protein
MSISTKKKHAGRLRRHNRSRKKVRRKEGKKK